MKKAIFIFTIFLLTSTLLAQSVKPKLDETENQIKEYQSKISELTETRKELQLAYIRERLHETGLPKLAEGEELIEHQAMMLVYSEEHEQAKWVAHIISKEIIGGGEGRTNDFREDPKIKTGSATEKDYFYKYEQMGETSYDGLGYDRGHLAPSADFRWNLEALSESYFYSNMSPQLGEFNREGWAELEGFLRAYVANKQVDLFVTTAPVLTPKLKVIERGVNQVSIPEYFYKIAYDPVNQNAIAFLIPHKKFEHLLDYYVVSIDSLESLTGIDFFHKLPDDIEQKIEKQKNFMSFVSTQKGMEVTPVENLPEGKHNTTEAKNFVGKNKKVTICGTIIATHKSKKGHVFIDVDKPFPDQTFSITIWKSDILNFSYEPEVELLHKKVCVTGKISEYKGVPTMYLTNEKNVEFLE